MTRHGDFLTDEWFRQSIIDAYVEVYGVEKWNALSDDEKDMVLHFVLNDFADGIMEK